MTDTSTYDIQLFENAEFGKLTVFIIDDNTCWFIGKEVALMLGYSDYKRALKTNVDENDKEVISKRDLSKGGLDSTFGNIPNRGLLCINESGLWSLILDSKLSKAKQLRHWVTSEVLPSIRKTGGYVNNDDLFIETYLPNADEATKIMFKTQLATIKNLNDKVGELMLANTALAEKATTWDNRKIINALVRSYAVNRCGGDVSSAWNYFYKQINYALNINIWKRKSPTAKSRLDVLSEGEMLSAVKVVAALCEYADLNVGKIIGETNAKLIESLHDTSVV